MNFVCYHTQLVWSKCFIRFIAITFTGRCTRVHFRTRPEERRNTAPLWLLLLLFVVNRVGLRNKQHPYKVNNFLLWRCTRISNDEQEAQLSPCQLKSCKLPRNSAETTRTTSREEIDGMKLEGYSGTMCNKHVHSAMMRSSLKCRKQTDDVELCISLVYRRLAVAKFSKSICRNCSRDPDHAHLGSTHSSQD